MEALVSYLLLLGQALPVLAVAVEEDIKLELLEQRPVAVALAAPLAP